MNSITQLDDLIFDNRFVNELPADPLTTNHRRQVANACYSRVLPTPVLKPELIAYSKEVAELLDLPVELCESEDFVMVFAGNRLAAGMEAYASCYGGHQFGQWAGQLGDGRAINLGEVLNQRGEHWTLQLKGAGLTPYSRTADGLAVLRSSVREFLCSEAMYHLGVPTTRALSLVKTGETVIRDMFYDGNPQEEQGAIVCRVAPSFIRFGNFQICTARKDFALLKQLLDFTIRTDFPYLGEPSPAVYLDWLAEVARRTAEMIVHWQRVGFVHGVMNTDNMSILGLTIDYGPYGWLDNFDFNWTPNTTDSGERRYRFGNQPNIALWNLGQLANAIYPLLEDIDIESIKAAVDVYKSTYEQGWQNMMAAKLGLQAFIPETDQTLCTEMLYLLQWIETDMTIFFRQLAHVDLRADISDEQLIAPLLDAYYVPEQLTLEYKERLVEWLKNYAKRVLMDGVVNDVRIKNMNVVNPKYVLRNYLSQLAIDKAEVGDYSLVNELLELFRHPYDEQPEKVMFAVKRPDWARKKPGCSTLSCSS